MIDRKLCLITIHDVNPSCAERLQKITNELDKLDVKYNLSVVPNYQYKYNLKNDSDFCNQLSALLQSDNVEITLHGYYHELDKKIENTPVIDQIFNFQTQLETFVNNCICNAVEILEGQYVQHRYKEPPTSICIIEHRSDWGILYSLLSPLLNELDSRLFTRDSFQTYTVSSKLLQHYEFNKHLLEQLDLRYNLYGSPCALTSNQLNWLGLQEKKSDYPLNSAKTQLKALNTRTLKTEFNIRLRNLCLSPSTLSIMLLNEILLDAKWLDESYHDFIKTSLLQPFHLKSVLDN